MLRNKPIIHQIFLIFLILPQVIQAQNIQQIAREGTKAMEDAYNAGNLQGVADIYADDAFLLGPNNYQVSGRKNIDNYWAGITYPEKWKLKVILVRDNEEELFKSKYWKSLENKPPLWYVQKPELKEKEGLIYQLGHSKLQYRRNDGGEIHTSHVDFVLIWAKQPDGGYKVLVDTYAANGK